MTNEPMAVPVVSTGRIALISDIHGNLPGLLAVLADIDRELCDGILCLGDLVDGGGHDDEVVRLVRDRAIPTVRGNHDWPNYLPLSPDVRDFLAGLPEQITDGDTAFTHITPRAKKNKVLDPYEAWNVFDETAYRRIFVGHAHIPLLFGERSGRPAEAREIPLCYREHISLGRGDRYVIVVGPVGYPRDGVRRPRYAIYDRAADTIEMRAVDGPVLPYG